MMDERRAINMNIFRTLAAIGSLALLLAGPAGAKPAAYIVTWTPGEGEIAGRAQVERNGSAMVPGLLMPLEAGDTVTVADEATTVFLETGDGALAAAGGERKRTTVSGQLNLAEEAAALAARLARALASAVSPAAPAGLAVPMAFDGSNFLVADGGPVHLSWTGGEAPYTLIFDIDGRRKELATTREQRISFEIPPLTRNRFSVIIKDQRRKRVRVDFRMRLELPAIPDAVLKAPVSPRFGDLLVKAWLAQRLDGMWRAHVVRLLRNSQAQTAVEQRLIGHLEAGGGL